MFVAAIAFRLRTFDRSTTREVKSGETSAAGAAVVTAGEQATPETATLVVADNATAPPTRAVTSTGASTREQRYEELLRSAPPSRSAIPAPPQPAEKRSMLQRVAAAMGIGEDKKPNTAPAPAAPRPPRPATRSGQPSQQQSGSSQNPQTTTDPKTNSQPQEEADAESDVRAPQLVGLEFTPNQVQDGEATTLAITAQDDLSGIRTISGVIANPSGQPSSGFAAQREGETNRYVARVVVPKDAAEGNWHIKYLTIADNASNTASLTFGQGLPPALATFRVTSSRSDAQGPELKALWIDRRVMSAGEKNTVFVQAEDDKAGVQIVSGVFVSPGKVARIGFGCKLGGTGAWECALNVPECVDCGLWQLEQIQLQDKANNTTTVRMDNQMVSTIQVDISGDRCDGAPPVLTGLSLNPLSIANGQATVISVTAQIQDDSCGGATLSGLVTGPQGQRLNIHFDQSKDGQNFTGRIKIDANQGRGKYNVTWIQALDKGQNLKAYSSSDPVVSRASFTIE